MGLAVLGSSLNTNWFGLADLDGDRFSSLHGTCEVINATLLSPAGLTRLSARRRSLFAEKFESVKCVLALLARRTLEGEGRDDTKI